MASIIENLYQRFFRGTANYAIGKSNDKGQSVYTPESGEATTILVEQHLLGNIILGAYTLHPNSKVNWIAFDVDASDILQARDITLKLHEFLINIPHAVEFSGNKGYHVIIFLRNSVEAARAKNLGEEVRDIVGGKRSGDPHVEVFPKQRELTTSNPLGNLLKVPLGIHPVSGKRSVFVDPYAGWEEGTPLNPIPILEAKANLGELAIQIDNYHKMQEAEDEEIEDRVIKLLISFWLPGQRHELALSLAGYYSQIGWEQDRTEALIQRFQEDGGGDLDNLLQCVRDTYKNYAEGRKVKGLSGLYSILSNKTVRTLVEISATDDDKPSMASIDTIRLGKLSHHLKVREASDTIMKFLTQEGELLKDEKNNKIYWLNKQDRNLYDTRDKTWEYFLHNSFGINSAEGFGRQTLVNLQSNSQEFSTPALTHARSWWTGDELWINLGTSTNYILDGTHHIGHSVNGTGSGRWGRTVLNGEEGIIFRNMDSHLSIDLDEAWDLGIREEDPWKYLVDDLNFSIGSTGVSPLQQRELVKAWFLSTFFPNVMPTRPMLTIVAAPGAGKTTAARRFLKVLEGPNSDVMGLMADKPDSLRASLASHKFIVLDNLEKSKAAHWLTDLLNRVSTGTHIELRKMYTTNETQNITPDCFIILTATALPFSEESLFSRLLPVELAPLSSPVPEYTMQRRVLDNLEGIWMGIFRILNEIVRELKTVTTAPAPTESRLADFSIFCARIQGLKIEGDGGVDGEALIRGLEMISNRQKSLLMESSPLVQVLDLWIKEDMAQHGGHQRDTEIWSSASELNVELRRMAHKHKLEWPWETGQALALHIKALEPHLIRMFGMRIRRGDGKHTPNQYRWEREIIDTVMRERWKKQKEQEKQESTFDSSVSDDNIDLER